MRLTFQVERRVRSVNATKMRSLTTFQERLLRAVGRNNSRFAQITIERPISLAKTTHPITRLDLHVINGQAGSHSALHTDHVRQRQAVILRRYRNFTDRFGIRLLVLFKASRHVSALLIKRTQVFRRSGARLRYRGADRNDVSRQFIGRANLRNLSHALMRL